MGVPRYTAETSIYKSSLYYRSAAAWSEIYQTNVDAAQFLTKPPACPCTRFEICLVSPGSPTGCILTGQTCYCEPIVGTCTGCVKACPPGQTKCGQFCVDLKTDPASCGACGNVCGTNMSCQNGVCACLPPFTDCGGACVDLSSDRASCGSCDNVCQVNMICSNGACICTPGLTNCSGSCANLLADPQNCGACGSICSTGVCCEGACGVDCGNGKCCQGVGSKCLFGEFCI
jgi:hypothetical protein